MIKDQRLSNKTRGYILIVLFILICITIFICNSKRNDPKYFYEPGWYEGHLNTARKQLQIIKIFLIDFYKFHSRYPTNDEGLAAIERLKPILHNIDSIKSDLDEYSQHDYEYIKKLQEEFEKISADFDASDSKKVREYLSTLYRNEMLYSEAGVLSSWWIPYVYENRTGMNQALFKDSPINNDTGQNYSIKIDEGVYVYSIGANIFYEQYEDLIFEETAVKTIPVLLIIIFLIFFFLFRPKSQPIWKKILKLALVLGGIVVFFAFTLRECRVTCYIMSYFSKARHPEMTVTYLELLDKYHRAGIINDETFNKRKKTMEEISKKVYGI